MAKLQGVIFDYGNVISWPQDQTCLIRMADLLGLDDAIEFHRVYQRYRREYDGGITGGAYWTKVSRELGRNVSQEQIRQLIELDTQSWVRINPRSIDCLRELKARGLKLALLSNMPREILNYLERECDWLRYFDSRVFSAPLGITKPDPRIYRHCVQQLALSPEECLFVDDLSENIAAAKEYGLNAIQYTGGEQLEQDLKRYLDQSV